MSHPAKPIDWEAALQWLEDGYLVSDLATIFQLSYDRISRRASKELTPEQRERWNAVNTRNRMKERWKGREAKCGTNGGYHAHKRRKEDACSDCRTAHSKAQQIYVASRTEAAGKVVERDELRVIASLYDVAFDDDAAPMMVPLEAFVVLVVKVAGTRYKCVLRPGRAIITPDPADSVIEGLLVSHCERIANVLQTGAGHPA